MKIYKYRDLIDSGIGLHGKLARLFSIIINNQVWCAKPSSLNDKDDEFMFQCNCQCTQYTKNLLFQSLIKHRDISILKAKWDADEAIKNGGFVEIANNTIDNLIADCRRSFGIVSFSYNGNDPALWDEYGGKGNGVCIEFDVPEEVFGVKLHNVNYVVSKLFHVDVLLRADLFPDKAMDAYVAFLATKTVRWQYENEVRCITKEQCVAMDIKNELGASVSGIVFGKHLPISLVSRIKARLRHSIGGHDVKLVE